MTPPLRLRSRCAALFLSLSFVALPAHADPVLMFILGFARNLLESSMNQAPQLARLGPADLPRTYPGTLVQPAHLQRLIDDCFLHLSQKQRNELFDTLNAELLKPVNAAVRGEMIQYFAQAALQVRALQMRLSQLSSLEKAALADEFGRSVAGMSAQERAELQLIVDRRLMPIPSDLGEMLAARIAQSPDAPVASLSAPQPAASQ